ncbi:hypothetical protein HAX54_036620, partial [Datura stramonium]|nr:hypothetical protein [Datura stramonium]
MPVTHRMIVGHQLNVVSGLEYNTSRTSPSCDKSGVEGWVTVVGQSGGRITRGWGITRYKVWRTSWEFEDSTIHSFKSSRVHWDT